jgi:hypothetical protein
MEEITNALIPWQIAKDRPKLVIRDFNLKLDALLKDIKDDVLGNVIAKMWVIKFQKKGLPHAHILLILDEMLKLRIAEYYDLMVSAEIPDPIHHPEAYETVTSCMVHGPCGPDFLNAQCMEQGKCKKRYPRSFNEETHYDVDGYLEYWRCQSRIFVDPKTQRVVNFQQVVTLGRNANGHLKILLGFFSWEKPYLQLDRSAAGHMGFCLNGQYPCTGLSPALC